MSKSIVKADMAPKKVLEFVPPKFDLGTPNQAQDYLDAKKARGSDFRMSDAIRVQTGVDKIEASMVEEDVEQKVLERLKEVQETAFQEAYQLGLDEGRKKAFKENADEIKARLDDFDGMLTSIMNLKAELIQHNETHLVQLAFHMAKRLAHGEVQADPKIVTEVIRNAVELAQIEEELTVQVSPEQIAFLEDLKKETGREFEFLKKIRFEPMQGMTPGGCIIQTNYGEIDARFEERVSKLWTSVSESLYRVKDKISAG